VDDLIDDLSEYHRGIGFGIEPASGEEYLRDLLDIYEKHIAKVKSERKQYDGRVRRKAARLGYRVCKSREWKHVPHLDNYGKYMLLDYTGNLTVLGHKFDATLDEIESFLEERSV
jgi:hypothetical protein